MIYDLMAPLKPKKVVNATTQRSEYRIEGPHDCSRYRNTGKCRCRIETISHRRLKFFTSEHRPYGHVPIIASICKDSRAYLFSHGGFISLPRSYDGAFRMRSDLVGFPHKFDGTCQKRLVLWWNFKDVMIFDQVWRILISLIRFPAVMPPASPCN